MVPLTPLNKLLIWPPETAAIVPALVITPPAVSVPTLVRLIRPLGALVRLPNTRNVALVMFITPRLITWLLAKLLDAAPTVLITAPAALVRVLPSRLPPKKLIVPALL